MTASKIGIIGFGNMGSAIAGKIKADYPVCVFDKDADKTKTAGMKVAASIIDLANAVEIVLLAVKPQDFAVVLDELKCCAKDKLIISIAAGITTGYIEKVLGKARVIRAMPNMPARIGEGATCLSKGRFAGLDDLDFAQNLFNYLGETLVIDEGLMNAATAVSGSGPGFCFALIQSKNIDFKNIGLLKKFINDFFIPELTKAAFAVGFGQEQSEFLAKATAFGCLGLLNKTNIVPAELRLKVASKGGTTEAGLEVLDEGGTLEEAVKAALKRAEELSRKE